ncbi:MAG: chemotaxis protein CheD [Nitrospirota bacterium]|nr:chemotaxis protein CheD [Nitrospirota bacterium]
MTARSCTQPTIYLKMGEMAFADQPSTITTVLGSCVAVTLFDSRQGHSAMCHGVMPFCASAGVCASECPRQGYYVECSVLAMVNRFRSSGLRTEDIEARVFGGAQLFTTPSRLRSLLAVGPQNIEAARRALKRIGIAVNSMIVGGRTGCRVNFNTMSGAVSVQRLDSVFSADGRN